MKSLSRRLYEKTDRSAGSDACWLWVGAKNSGGYGKLRILSRFIDAHRVSWECAHGPIPVGQHILHTCDNPPCVNPRHLKLGDHKANIADMMAKGRQVHGEKNGRAKLTAQQVLALRRLRADHGFSRRILAQRFNIHVRSVDRILAGRRWTRLLEAS